MLIPSRVVMAGMCLSSLSRRVNANSQPFDRMVKRKRKLIKKGEC